MELGLLIRATAHEVTPRQIGDFEGGFVENLADLSAALHKHALVEPLRDATPVSFVFEGNERQHPVRDHFVSFAFGDGAGQLAASRGLCERLAAEMDGRNKPCLLLLSAHETESVDEREVIVWVFPADVVIRRSGDHVSLEDAFSLTSGLRKAANFRGSGLRTGFLSGRALDHQANHTDQRLAEFWISGFLGCAVQIQAREGTRLAAMAFRNANKALAGDEPAQGRLLAALAQYRARVDRAWSLEDVASELLAAGTARDAFVAAIGTGPDTKAPFRLALEAFDAQIKFRVFKLENGVTVSSPFVEVGHDVEVTESEAGSTLRVTGLIVGETIRARS
jgi:hypothetical protein